MMYDLKDKVVLITGAASGIGNSVVRLLLEECVKAVVVLDIAEEEGIKFQNEMNSKYGSSKLKFIKCDIMDEEQLTDAFNETKTVYGYIDLVINNAGIMNDSLKAYKKQIELNVTALVTSTLIAIEMMRKDKGGKGGTVINTSSILALMQSPTLPIYSGTKSAVMQFSNIIGVPEYFDITGVRVLTICYGATETALLSETKVGFTDESFEKTFFYAINGNGRRTQKKESAALGVLEYYKNGETGSTWVAVNDRPIKDITSAVKQSYKIMTDAFEL